MRYYELHFECPPCSQLVTWSPFLPCGSCGLALSKCPALGWWRWLPASICYWSSAQWRSLRHLAGGACWRVMTRDAMPCMRCTLHTSAHNAMCDELSSDMSRTRSDIVLFDHSSSGWFYIWFCLILFDSIWYFDVWLYLSRPVWPLGPTEEGREKLECWPPCVAFRHARFGFSQCSQAGAVARPQSGDVELLDPTQPPETQKAKSTNLLLPVFTFSR